MFSLYLGQDQLFLKDILKLYLAHIATEYQINILILAHFDIYRLVKKLCMFSNLLAV